MRKAADWPLDQESYITAFRRTPDHARRRTYRPFGPLRTALPLPCAVRVRASPGPRALWIKRRPWTSSINYQLERMDWWYWSVLAPWKFAPFNKPTQRPNLLRAIPNWPRSSPLPLPLPLPPPLRADLQLRPPDDCSGTETRLTLPIPHSLRNNRVLGTIKWVGNPKWTRSLQARPIRPSPRVTREATIGACSRTRPRTLNGPYLLHPRLLLSEQRALWTCRCHACESSTWLSLSDKSFPAHSIAGPVRHPRTIVPTHDSSPGQQWSAIRTATSARARSFNALYSDAEKNSQTTNACWSTWPAVSTWLRANTGVTTTCVLSASMM